MTLKFFKLLQRNIEAISRALAAYHAEKTMNFPGFFLFSFGVYGTENRRSDTLPSVNSVIIYSCIIS